MFNLGLCPRNKSQHELGLTPSQTLPLKGQGGGDKIFLTVFIGHNTICRSDKVGTWLSLVEHRVRDAGVAGSNPVVPTSKNKGFGTF